MITSGCTWWDPNEAEYAVADAPLGPWEVKGNPCIGKDGDKTFYSQSTFVLPINGSSNTFIFMADRWKEEDLGDSRYIWLPFTIEDDEVQIQWLDYWQLQLAIKEDWGIYMQTIATTLQNWNSVILESAFVRVQLIPELGAKIVSLQNKQTGKVYQHM